MLYKQMNKCCSQIQISSTHTTSYSFETFMSAMWANKPSIMNLDNCQVSELTLCYFRKNTNNPIWLHSVNVYSIMNYCPQYVPCYFHLRHSSKVKDAIEVSIPKRNLDSWFVFIYTHIVNHFNNMATQSGCKQTHLKMCHCHKIFKLSRNLWKFVLSYDLAIIQQTI